MSEKAQCAECQQPADLICTGCRMVSYCNKEHQKQHWKEHKSVCRPIEVIYALKRDRYLSFNAKIFAI